MTNSHRVARGNRLQVGLILAGLTAATGLIYGQALGFEFINTDDPTYVTQNAHVLRGLTVANLAWSFTSMTVANWHPLTWLSHMLDVELFGIDPRGHHLGNVLLHVANTLLLFGLLRSITGAAGKSACVALLFAIHPLHVESVAWVSERKDVLCGFFWLLALWSYSKQVAKARPRKPNLALPCLLAALALLSKPMAVTLPFTLLLLDYWPLKRLGRDSLWARLVEKLPFFALSFFASLLTLMAQRAGGALQTGAEMSLAMRLSNAAVSYAAYLGKCVWPVDLAMLYPHPYIAGTGGAPWELWQIAGSVALLLAISALVVLARRGYLAMGWLWYLGTLVPAIGVVQAGTQAFADRYTYFPLIGIFVMAVWGVAELTEGLRRRRAKVRPVGLFLVLGVAATLGWTSWGQAKLWQNSISLYENTLRVTPNNTIVHLSLASSLVPEGRTQDAMRHASRALELKPDYGEAHDTIGRIHKLAGRHEEARRSFRRAVSLSPNSSRLHTNLGNQLLLMDQPDAAIRHFERAAELARDSPKPLLALAEVHRKRGQLERAASSYQSALEIQPELTRARIELADTLALLERWSEAVEHYEVILERNPQNAKARYGLERSRDGRKLRP